MDKKGGLITGLITIIIILVILFLALSYINENYNPYDNSCIIEEMEEFCDGDINYNPLIQIQRTPFNKEIILKFSCIIDNKEEEFVFTKDDIRRCKK